MTTSDTTTTTGSTRADTTGASDTGTSARGRFNAWFFTAFAGYINHVARPHKRAAFADLDTSSTVVEIGAGTGANLAYLPTGTRVVAVEPNRAMHDRLRRRCADIGVEVTVVADGAESIPLPDACVDEVISSLVLCTVADPERALAEVRRVLRPGGRFRFVEHVAAPRRGVRRAVQRAVRRPWGWLFEGCQPDRHTLDAVRAAGFAEVRAEHRLLRQSLFFPVNTAVWGVAIR
jgi:SAM-dependent methyltransferase